MSWKKIGPKTWEVTARDGAGRQRRRRFDNARAARAYDRKLAEEREQVRETGRRPHTAENVTLADYCAEFLSAHPVKPQTLRTLAYRLAIVTAELGDSPLAFLTRVNIGRWANEKLPDYAPTTQRLILKALRQVLGQAVRDGLLPDNPASEVALANLSRPPIRPLRSWEEVERVASHAGRHGPLIRFAARTGLRPQEWLAVHAGDFNLPARRLTISRTVQNGRIQEGAAKTRRSHRTVVLSDAALDALHAHGLPDNPDALVFTSSDGGLINLHNWTNRVFHPALDAAGVERRGPKNLRHTFATLALSQDPTIPIQDVQRQLGHEDIATTLAYYTAYMPQQDERLLRLLNEAEGIPPVRVAA
jgi:integrase